MRSVSYGAVLVTLAGLLAATACGAARSKRCSPRMLLDRIEGQVVYTQCAVDRPVPNTATTTAIQWEGTATSSCYRATIEVVVDPAGRPLMHTARIVSTNEAGYAERILQMMGEARYRPAMKNGIAVHSLARFEHMQPARFVAGSASGQCG